MKSRLVIKLVIVSNILLVIALSLLVIQIFKSESKSKNITQQVTANEVVSLPSIEEETPKQDFSVSVCGSTSCVWISSIGIIKEGELDENALYQRILDTVIPHFENKYGGKTFAKNRAGSFIYWKGDIRPDLSNIYTDVLNAFKEGKSKSIQIEIKDLPGTEGTYATRYIEIDDSKQKLYVWIDGTVIKEINLSAAKKGYQVYGVFPIIDKGIAPIAPGEKYMPYWMAFYYSPKQDSWYGLHALIWWYDDNGKKVYEPEEYIGVRRSRGCIRMLVEDAKYIYGIFEKGDPILIHE